MPRRERSFAQEIEERLAAGEVAYEDAARVAVADDIVTGRLGHRCNFEEGVPARITRVEIGSKIEPEFPAAYGLKIEPEFRPVLQRPSYARNLWQQIRAGKVDNFPVKFSPDNKTIRP